MFLVKFDDGWEVCEALVTNQIEASSPRYDVMAYFAIFTAREKEREESEGEATTMKQQSQQP